MGMDKLILTYNAEKMELKISPICSSRICNIAEVVKCGACKYWLEIEETEGGGYCNHPHWMLALAEPPIVQFNDFCSYGERREGE